MQFAEIILPLNLPNTLTYGVPVEWQGKILPGMRVEVNLGKNKMFAGIVAFLHDQKPEAYSIKPIRNVIDEEPVVLPVQMQFWQWVSQYYLCSIGEVMNAALPAHLKLMSESLLIWNELYDTPPLDLSDNAFIIAEALHIRKQLTIGEVRQLLEGKNTSKAINELLELEVATVTEILEEKYKAKTERFVFLEKSFEEDEAKLSKLFDELKKAPKQLELLMTFFQMKQQSAVAVPELLKKAKATSSQLNTLVEKGVLRLESIALDRLALLEEKKIAFELNTHQQEAFEKIKEDWQKHKVALLHGVTGSGKTLIYVQLIKEAIANGKQALFLLPEIALTTQVVSRLRAYFGDELGVYHSRFTNNERVEIWNKVKEGKYKAIIGPRSAVWLPFQHLETIIVDEEHDNSFKQYEPSPRFHARDAAIYLSTLHDAKVLLGSATPSLESAYNAQKGKYAYIQLNKRYGDVAMPLVEIVSAKNTQAALSNILTLNLLEKITETLALGKQVILFQNKRGYAPFLICGSCGWVAHCKYCDVSLTYHKATDRLHCHYCGSQSAVFKHCPQCGNMKIVAKSFGTEKIEEELQRIFPKVKTARLDWDSVKGKNKLSQLIEDFTKGRIDILVGTQMVVKGLDFENVGLVGILSADSLLSYPDFRVNERGFQLMEQVSGRAGRADGKGQVIIQTFNMQHPVLQWVKDHDFRSFYHIESGSRQQFGYPPFSRMIKLTIKHREIKKAEQGAQQLAEELKKIKNIHIQGPAEALVSRVRNYYIQEIWLKLPNDPAFLQHTKGMIAIAMNATMQKRGNSALQIAADVDPY
ncbi:primosomal protein N' [Taibaiella lutea]|uniref:Replication restart protein PriA n=1 Tax=Taibaiella lutea TaxID=2608001 RepID=A0A5M6CDS7_9BACT|nr:primosomal protein N' [Taibaiella lutea]KAA5533276.1 primosomal protein N' [Taibaiella lutea]